MRSALKSRLAWTVLCVLMAATALLTSAAQTPKDSFLQWRLLSQAPILSPQGDSWESAGTFNPAVIRVGEKFVMPYRAVDRNGTSRLGYAQSTDGIHFSRSERPVLNPEAAYEKNGGVEDPRLVEIAGKS